MEADKKQIQTPVFIQPDSDQPCLLGMNAAPSLNLQFLRSDGEPLTCFGDHEENTLTRETAKVSLVETSTIPARKGRFLEAIIEPILSNGVQLLFEPTVQTLQPEGVSAQDVLLTVAPHGTILVPL